MHHAAAQTSAHPEPGASAQALLSRVAASPELPFCATSLRAVAPSPGLPATAISGLAFTRSGLLAEIQRGSTPAVLVLDAKGHVRQAFGSAGYVIAHTVRVDPEGNFWTVDAGSSAILKYSWSGKLLLSVQVPGAHPDDGTFSGATDIAFAPDGHFFIADGYANARILEFDARGALLTQWGEPGANPGQLNLPHSLQFSRGQLYVADRENHRIQVFSRTGTPLRQFDGLGRVYSIRVTDNALWASVGSPDEAPGAGTTYILKLNPATGLVLGHLTVNEPRSGHSLDLSPDGEPVITSGDHLLWFQPSCLR